MNLSKTEQKILNENLNGYISVSSGWKKRTKTTYGRREQYAITKLKEKGIVEHIETFTHDDGTWWTIDSIFKIVDENYL